VNEVTAQEFANGTVGYKINAAAGRSIWKQTIGGTNADPYPVFSGAEIVYNFATSSFDNHNHAPTVTLVSVNKTNDSVCIVCSICAPDGVYITVSMEEGLTYSNGVTPVGTVTPPDGAVLYYKKGNEVLTVAPSNAGDYTVNFDYGGVTASVAYTIAPKSIEQNVEADLTNAGKYTYNGKEHTAVFKIYDKTQGRLLLQEGVDYILSGHKQTNAGRYTVTITGIGNYTGSITSRFDIAKGIPRFTTYPTANELYYDGSEQALVTPGEVTVERGNSHGCGCRHV
jgi:hypothetical protein